jgi:methyl-accepting chemotaxis protein
MAQKTEGVKRFRFSGSAIMRVCLSAVFAFCFFLIWNSTADLKEKLSIVTAQYSSILNVQVEYKTEVQEWKNLLLRSTSKDTLDKNWQIYEAQYLKVAIQSQTIILESDVRVVKERMKQFVELHDANHELYKKSLDIFIKSGFDPHPADTAVKGIDRPLLDLLETADEAMQDEKKNINESLTAKARKQIDQSLLILGFVALIVIWMPKW